MDYNSAEPEQLAVIRPIYLVGYINYNMRLIDSDGTLPAQTVRNVLMLLYCYYGHVAQHTCRTVLMRHYPVLYHGIYYPTAGGVGDVKLDHDRLDDSTLSHYTCSSGDLLTLGVSPAMSRDERIYLLDTIGHGLLTVCHPTGDLNKITNHVASVVQSLPYWARSIWWSTDTDGTVRQYIMDNDRLIDEVYSQLIK